MQAQAKATQDLTGQVVQMDGETILTVDCRDFDHYKSLPDVVLLNFPSLQISNMRLGKTGWSSDKYYACYKDGVPIATPVR